MRYYSFFNRIVNLFNRSLPRFSYKKIWNRLSYFDKQAVINVIGESSEQEILSTAEETRASLLQTVQIFPDDVIVEIGCGIGRVGNVIAPLCQEWIGCEVSANMLKHAAKRLENFPNVTLKEISGFDLSVIDDSTADLVYCTVVFMHLDEWERYHYVCEAHRVLKNSGRIFIDNFNLCSEEGWKIFEHHCSIAPHKRTAHISTSSTPQEIETYLVRAGFREVKLRSSGMWIQGYAQK